MKKYINKYINFFKSTLFYYIVVCLDKIYIPMIITFCVNIISANLSRMLNRNECNSLIRPFTMNFEWSLY